MNKYQHISNILEIFENSGLSELKLPGKLFTFEDENGDIYMPDDFVVIYKEVFNKEMIFEYKPMFDSYTFTVKSSDKDA